MDCLLAHSNWKSNNFPEHTDRVSCLKPFTNAMVGLTTPNTDGPSPLSLSTSLNQTNRASVSAAADCLSWTFGSWSQLSSSQWTMHQSISLSFHAVPHIGYFPASRQIAVEEHKRWAASMWRRRRDGSPRSDASFVRLQRNPFSPRRWSIHQAHPDICQKPSLTSTVWRSKSADQWLSC